MNKLTLALLCLAPLTLLACSEESDESTSENAPVTNAPKINAELVRANNIGVGMMGYFDYDGAVQHFTALHEAHPGNHEVTVNLAIATLNRQQDGDEAEALALLESVIDEDPAHARARYCAGLLNLNNGNSAQALEYFSSVAQQIQSDAFAQYYKGLCTLQAGDAVGATPAFERALAIDPYLRSAHYGLFQSKQRAGDTEAARAHLEQFQKLAENPRAHLAEFKYTRMGELGMARVFDDPDAEPVAEADPFRAFGEPVELVPGVEWVSLITNGSVYGLSAADIDGDGDTDVLIEHMGIAGPEGERFSNGLRTLLLNENGAFSPAESFPLPVPLIRATLWGDIDNDGDIDAYFCCRGPNVLMINEGDGEWRDATDEFGASGGDVDTKAGVLVDADHDGDLDIFLLNDGARNALLNNNRDGTFTDIAPDHGIAGDPEARPIGVLFADLDNDRDLDFIVINREPPHEAYENRLLWDYAPMEGFDEFKSTSLSAVAIADTDVDGQPELFTVDGQTMRHWSPQNGEWTAVHSRPAEGSRDLFVLDADHDGQLELLHTSPYRLTLAELHPGDDTWSYEVSEEGLGYGVQSIMPVVLDPERGVELLAVMNGTPVLFPAGEGRQNALALQLAGGENDADAMRTNFSAIGTTVRARVGSRWTSNVSLPNSTSIRGQSLTPLPLGIGPASRADYIEILWPDGVYQTELNLEANKLHEVPETQRQLSSCPVLFAWNGEEYAFVSDILGTGGIGFAIGPGEYATPDPTEAFLFPEGSLAPRDGKLSVRIGEPMEEVAYFDRLSMLTYDLPPGWSMTLDERMHTGGEFEPTGEAIYYRRSSAPIRATNDRGEDITRSIASQDNDAAPLPGRDSRFIGRTSEEHVITLEFDEPIDSKPGEPVLVVDGWVEYPYSQVMFAAWQAGATYEPMTLEAFDPATGEWVTLMDQFGYPAGMPRQMSAPIPGLPEGATQLRIRTTLEIYFDRIFVAQAEDCPAARVTELQMASAELREVGFPHRINHAQRRPDYDYSDRAPLWDTRHPEGWYTAFGPCDELISREDGALAIIGPGEEVHVEWISTKDMHPDGWSRRYVLDSKGWCKDMDLYTRTRDTIEPMPVAPENDHAEALMRDSRTRWRSGR